MIAWVCSKLFCSFNFHYRKTVWQKVMNGYGYKVQCKWCKVDLEPLNKLTSYERVFVHGKKPFKIELKK